LHESFQRNGDLWKFVPDLAIDSQQPNSVRMRRRDEFTVISRAFRSDYFLVQAWNRNGSISALNARTGLKFGD